MFILVELEAGREIPIDRQIIIVGRDPQSDVRLESIRVSRQHCVLAASAAGVEVRDLASTNGVWLNGQRGSSFVARAGDEVAIANIRFRVEERQGSSSLETRLDTSALPTTPLAEAVRAMLPAGVAKRCTVKVVVSPAGGGEAPAGNA